MNIPEQGSEDVFHLGVKGLVKNNEGEILLLKVNPAKLKGSQNNYWDLPGGRVQKDQTVAQTLIREIEEEIGISDVNVVNPIGMTLSNIRIPIGNDETVGLILSVYLCTIPEESAVLLSDEHIEYGWFPPGESAKLLAIKYPPDFCEIIARLT